MKNNIRIIIGCIFVVVGFISAIIVAIQSLIMRFSTYAHLTNAEFLIENPERIVLALVCAIIAYIGYLIIYKIGN